MSDIDICNVFKMMQEFKLLKNLVLGNFSKFLFRNQKRFVLNLEPSTILTREQTRLKTLEYMDNIEGKFKEIMKDENLSKNNRYLLASIFKKRPIRNDENAEVKGEGESPIRVKKKVLKRDS